MSQAEEWVDPWEELSNGGDGLEDESAWVSVKSCHGALTSAPPAPLDLELTPTLSSFDAVDRCAVRAAPGLGSVDPRMPFEEARSMPTAFDPAEESSVERVEEDLIEVYVDEDPTDCGLLLDASTVSCYVGTPIRPSSEPVPLVDVVEAGVAVAVAWDDRPTVVELDAPCLDRETIPVEIPQLEQD